MSLVRSWWFPTHSRNSRRFITVFAIAHHLCPVTTQMKLGHASYLFGVNFVLPSHLHLGLQKVVYSVFPRKLCKHISPPLYVSHIPPISTPAIWLPEWWLWGLNIIKLFIMHFTTVSGYSFLSGPIGFLSTKFSNTLVLCSSLSRQFEFHTHKTMEKLLFCMLWSSFLEMARGKT